MQLSYSDTSLLSADPNHFLQQQLTLHRYMLYSPLTLVICLPRIAKQRTKDIQASSLAVPCRPLPPSSLLGSTFFSDRYPHLLLCNVDHRVAHLILQTPFLNLLPQTHHSCHPPPCPHASFETAPRSLHPPS